MQLFLIKHFIILVGILCFLRSNASAQKQHILLVGIDTYATDVQATSPTLSESRTLRDLRGSVNDVQAMASLLKSKFAVPDQYLHTLTDREATRENIIDAINQFLIEPAKPGDHLLFYFAGHGSKIRNTQSTEPDQMDETIVPADSYKGVRDIRDKELHSLFNKALDTGASLTLIFDSCHSGSIVRGNLPTHVRTLSPDQNQRVSDDSSTPKIEERDAVILAASQDYQFAREWNDTLGNRRGLFTWALTKVLATAPLSQPLSLTMLQVQALIRSLGINQTPVISGSIERQQTGLFTDTVSQNNIVVAVSGQTESGFLIEGGSALGLRPGIVLRAVQNNPELQTIKLKIESVHSLIQSEAVQTSGSSTPEAGMLFEVESWAAPQPTDLRIWFSQAVSQKITLPNNSSYSDFKKNLASRINQEGLPIQLVPDSSDSDYVLRYYAEGETIGSYQWIQQGRISEEKERVSHPLHPPPVPSTFNSSNDLDSLLKQLQVISRTWRWFHLESPPNRNQFAYRLGGLKKINSEKTITDNGIYKQDERYFFYLEPIIPKPVGIPQKRYIYLFAIDAAGNLFLLYPKKEMGHVENRFPVNDHIDSPVFIGSQTEGLIKIQAPFGTDTFFYLTSDEPIPFTIFDNELTRAEHSNNPASLEAFLYRTINGIRGNAHPLSIDWSIQRMSVTSVP